MSFTKEKREKIQHNMLELINNDDADFISKLIKKYDPNAFIVVNETKKVYNGYFSK